MNQDELFSRHRKASRRAMWGALATGVVVAGVIGSQGARLTELETKLLEQDNRLQSLSQQKESLSRALYALREDPEGGVRGYAKRLNTDSRLYDFSIWIDPSRLASPVTEIRYEFPGSPYDAARSTLESNGFATFFRGATCPGQVLLTIVFDDGSSRVIDYDLCAAVDL